MTDRPDVQTHARSSWLPIAWTCWQDVMWLLQHAGRQLDCRQQPKLTINCYVRMHRSTMTAVTCAADVTTCLSSVNNSCIVCGGRIGRRQHANTHFPQCRCAVTKQACRCQAAQRLQAKMDLNTCDALHYLSCK